MHCINLTQSAVRCGVVRLDRPLAIKSCLFLTRSGSFVFLTMTVNEQERPSLLLEC